MKKALCLILAALMLLGVTGCSNTATTSEKAAFKLGVPNGSKLTPQEIIDGFVAEYSNKYDITVDDTPWGEFKTKLNLGIASGTAPDVYMMDSGYVADAGHSGAAVDLKPLIERDLKTDEFVSAFLSGEDKNGKIWGVPHALNCTAVFYNKDLFDKYGVEYPTADWTWDEMVEKAKKLSVDENGDGVNESYGYSAATNITLGWLPLMLSYGKEPIDETYTKAQFDDPEIRKIFDVYRDFRYGIQIWPKKDWAGLYGNFYQGKLGMWVASTTSIDVIAQNAPDMNYDIQVFPKGPAGENNNVFVPNMWSIYSRATEGAQQAAWDWLKYYYSEESQNICAKYCLGGFPVRKTAVEKMKEDTKLNKAGIVAGIDKNGHTLCEGPGWSEWRSIVDKAFADYMSQQPTKDFDTIISDTQTKVQAVLDAENAKIQ